MRKNKNEKKNEVKEENKETTKDDTKKEVEKIKVNELPKEIKSEERKVSTDFIKIRVNNCFVNAKKSYLTDLLAKWDDFVIYEANANKSLMTYVVDTIPVTASNEYAIISNKVDYTNDLINQNIESLEKDLAMFYGKPYKLVAITESDWNHIKEEYINNLKKGYKYEMMDENMMEEQEARNVTDLEKLAEEIFGTNNYEVK